MSGWEVKECRSCGAPVIWTTTHNGKRMPVDAEPRSDGNIRLRQEGGTSSTGKITAEYPGHEAPSLFEEDGARYVSHFATCPDAGKYRRGT